MRISKRDYYLNIAREVSRRSPCLKMQVGAILVKDDSILSTGYNGPARGEPHCRECHRISKSTGSEYVICPAVHAEENCVINAARQGVSVLDSTMYIWIPIPGKVEPCYRCKRIIKNSGITKVITK